MARHSPNVYRGCGVANHAALANETPPTFAGLETALLGLGANMLGIWVVGAEISSTRGR